MITESMMKIMEQIKEIDPTFEFITEEELEECKKEDPSFELTEEDLKEALAHRKLSQEIKRIAEIDMNAKNNKVQSNLVEEEIFNDYGKDKTNNATN